VINPELVRVTGPLSPFREGFGTWLEPAGYARKMRAVHLRLMGDLSCWLGEREETIAGLSTPLLVEFIAGRRAAGQRTGLSVRALRPLAEYLRGTGAVPAEEPARDDHLTPARLPAITLRHQLTRRVTSARLPVPGSAHRPVHRHPAP
jgi:hypothetical protein